jgi:ABC-type cobalamin/Fe3+-siderophores transport system ATPase subunit
MLLEIRNLTGPSARSSSPTTSPSMWQEGEALGIIGPNGAGKSSLFNLITGRLKPQGGTIALDGQDITAMPRASACMPGSGAASRSRSPSST